MKKVLSLLIVLIVACGCPATTATHLTGDDATVARAVEAEKVLFNSANTLFVIEKGQEAALAVPFKDLHIYTQTERLEVPRLLLTIRTYTRIYRVTTTTPKPDFMPVITRTESLSVEIRGWLTQVALTDIPPVAPPARHAALTTGNPYVDAIVQLMGLVETGLTLYQSAKTQTVLNGALIDADENTFHANEDTAMASAAWQLN